MHIDRQRLRATLPDVPRWTETRHLLGSAQSRVHVDPNAPDPAFIVVDEARVPFAAVVGRPHADLIRLAASQAGELLAFPDNVDDVKSALPGWAVERAILHTLPDWSTVSAVPAYPTRVLASSEVATFTHVEPELMAELQDAEDEGVDIVAALDGALPVAFCYAGATTETLWDVAIDTVPSHRRRGYAAAAASQLIRRQAERGLAPVWCALESNEASLGLARKLGFQEVDAIWLLTPGATPHSSPADDDLDDPSGT